jgi:hypothetical protein
VRKIDEHPFISLVLLLGVLVAAFFIGYFYSEPEGQAQPLPPLVPSKFDARLLVLDREAVENAYRTKIESLINVWLRDDTDQPRRAINGARAARKAFIGAMTEIEKREHAATDQPR